MQTILFLIGSALLIFISRRNLQALQSHGFFRFLAWECMLLLLLRQCSMRPAGLDALLIPSDAPQRP